MPLRGCDCYGTGQWYEARPWQRDVIDVIKDEPYDFNLVVVVDCSLNGTGKSHIVQHYDKYINHSEDYTCDHVCRIRMEHDSCDRNSTICARKYNLNTRILFLDGPHTAILYPPVKFLKNLIRGYLVYRNTSYKVPPCNIVLMSRVWSTDLYNLNPKKVVFIHGDNSDNNLINYYNN